MRNLTPTGAIILAAGGSTRMGSPKQLLPYGKTTLLGNAIDQAGKAGFERIVVVVGAQADRVRQSISEFETLFPDDSRPPLEVAENPFWQTGMGSSITVGLAHIEAAGVPLPAVAVLLADQPYIRFGHLLALRELLDDSALPIAAAEYDNQPGVPAIFRRDTFPLLAGLPPGAGARHVLRDSGLRIARYPLKEAATDVDTPADFAALAAVRP